MMKNLRYFLMSMFVMLCGSAMAADVVIDFNAMDLPTSCSANADQGIEASDAGDIVEAKVIEQDGVTITISPKEEGNKNANRFWQTNNGPQLRCYSGTITVKYTAAMKSIAFDAPSKFALTAATGTIDGKAWSGEAAEVVFTVTGNTQINKITISTEGSGQVTPDPQPATNAITVAQALEIINGLADGAKTDADYIVKGYVVSVSEISAQYGNATFTIADQKGGEPVLTIFRTKGFNGENITDENLLKVDDLVEVQGKLQKYVKDAVVTPELAQGGKILTINGQTGSGDTPTPQPTAETITVAKALEIINGLADGAKTDAEYIVKGYVVSVTEISAQYGNATFTVADQKGGEPVLTIFRVKDANGENITNENFLKADDLVEVQGKLQKYVKDAVVTPELAQGGKILTVNGQSASGITTLKVVANSGAVYTLSGQRVEKATKGLFIRDGKKYMVK